MKTILGILLICLVSTSMIQSEPRALNLFYALENDSLSLSSGMQIAFNRKGKLPGFECGKGICFISFKVSKKQILEDLTFSITTPIALRSFIQDYLLSVNGKWNSILKQPNRASLTYLLPVSYWLGSCPKAGDTLFIVAGEIYNASKIPGLSENNVYPPFYQDLLNIPNLEKDAQKNTKGKVTQYVILPSVVLRRNVIE
ncbi:MAG: hypothetical protein V4450_00015 [Bacteroidota bacterium]